jgi:hypothetical protein
MVMLCAQMPEGEQVAPGDCLWQYVCIFLVCSVSFSGRLAMTPEDRELTNWLCTQIQEEQDPKTFSELVWQLDALLAIKDTALQNYCKPN